MAERFGLRPCAGELRGLGIPHHAQPGDGPDPPPPRQGSDREQRPSFEPGEEDATGELSRSFDLASALSRISPVHREVLTLAYFHGLSQSEISRHTDTPLGTVKSRTTAALRALRESMLEDEGG